jgi:hypothetical protein
MVDKAIIGRSLFGDLPQFFGLHPVVDAHPGDEGNDERDEGDHQFPHHESHPPESGVELRHVHLPGAGVGRDVGRVWSADAVVARGVVQPCHAVEDSRDAKHQGDHEKGTRESVS